MLAREKCIGVTTAKLSPLLKHYKVSYKMRSKFYNALYWKDWFGFLQIESHIWVLILATF